MTQSIVEQRREAIARIIDPMAFLTLREIAAEAGLDAENPPPGVILLDPIDGPRNAMRERCEAAYAKADAILALTSNPPAPGGEGDCSHLWSGSGPDGSKRCVYCHAVVDHNYRIIRRPPPPEQPKGEVEPAAWLWDMTVNGRTTREITSHKPAGGPAVSNLTPLYRGRQAFGETE